MLLATVEAIRESTAPSAEPTEIELLTDARTYRFRAESVSDRDDCAHPRRLLTWEVGQVYLGSDLRICGAGIAALRSAVEQCGPKD